MENLPSDNSYFNIEVRTIPLPLIAVHQSWPGHTPVEALAKFKKHLEENSKSGEVQDNTPLGVSLKALKSNRIADYIVKDKEGTVVFKEQANPELLFPY